MAEPVMLRTQFDGPVVRSFETSSGKRVVVGAADGLSLWIDLDQAEPQAVIASYANGGGYFMAYTRAADLEKLAELILVGAEHLRLRPTKEPEAS